MVVSNYFTPVTGFTGGALVGLSAATLLLLDGEILGASGIVSSVLLHPKKALTDPSTAWKLVFLSVFLLLSNTVLAKYFTDDDRLTGQQDPSIPIVSSYGYLLGGLFVGFGTRMGNGCTSGHGICGMARFSKRSIVGVCTFMASAFATAAVVAPDNKAFADGTAWLRTDTVPVFFNRWLGFAVIMPIVVIPSCFGLFNLWMSSRNGVAHSERWTTTQGSCASGSPCCKEAISLHEHQPIGRKQQHSIYDPSGLTVAEEEHSSQEYGAFDVPLSSNNSNPIMTVVVVEGDEEGRALSKSENTMSDGVNLETLIDQERDVESCPTRNGGGTLTIEALPESDPSSQNGNITTASSNRNNNPVTTSTVRDDNVIKLLPSALASALFAVGLAVSEMVLPSKVLGFLNLFTVSLGTYDPTLLTVMVGGCIVSMISYQFIGTYSLIPSKYTQRWANIQLLDKPILANKFSIPTNRIVDIPLVGGAFCFGIGWAVAGLCPGPAMFLAASGTKPVLIFWWPMFLVGSFGAQWLKDKAATSCQ